MLEQGLHRVGGALRKERAEGEDGDEDAPYTQVPSEVNRPDWKEAGGRRGGEGGGMKRVCACAERGGRG